MSSVLTAMKVPFHRASLGEEEIQAATEVLRSGWLTMGAKTFEFERRFAEYIGARHAVAVSSCTAALHLSLEAIGLQPGDEVLLPTTTFTATAEVVSYLRGIPVLVDIEPGTMNLSVDGLERSITPRTRAVIPVHFAGQPCDMGPIRDLAARHKLHVIEDAAHALPSEYHGRRIGSISELTAFSFYATKTLTTGEGGMITTEDGSYLQRIQMMRLHGISRDAWNRYGSGGSWRYQVREAGFKYNLTDIQSAIGLAQLARCDDMYEARRRIAGLYSREFAASEVLEVPEVPADCRSSWHLYVLRLQTEALRIDRDGFVTALAERGVNASVHFIPLHLHPFYQRQFNYKAGDFPRAEREFQRCFSLPIYPSMTDEEIAYVIATVLELARQESR
ncbi:MAG TPA: DegT/DnrJ/EryC1/StrS family aminotransferase [Terriglobales bacterium]